MFLVLIDAHTKWMEVFRVASASANVTIQQLRTTFAQFGLPHSVVTDNGSCFMCEDFRAFLRLNGIQHITTAPYHPASNGQAERAVQVFKHGFKRVINVTITDRIARFLFSYRITPHFTTGVSPAELMFGRKCRLHLDLLLPDYTVRVEAQQQWQKEQHDLHAHNRVVSNGEQVYARNFRPGEMCLPGCIFKAKGPVSFLVRLTDGQVIKRHVDHVRKRLPEHRQQAKQTPGSLAARAQGCFTEEDIVLQARSSEPTTVTPDSVSAAAGSRPINGAHCLQGQAHRCHSRQHIVIPPVQELHLSGIGVERTLLLTYVFSLGGRNCYDWTHTRTQTHIL